MRLAGDNVCIELVEEVCIQVAAVALCNCLGLRRFLDGRRVFSCFEVRDGLEGYLILRMRRRRGMVLRNGFSFAVNVPAGFIGNDVIFPLKTMEALPTNV